MVGLLLSSRIVIPVLWVRVLDAEPQTGAAIKLALSFLLFAFAGVAWLDTAHRAVGSMFRISSIRWVFVFLAFSGCSLLWSETASPLASAVYWWNRRRCRHRSPPAAPGFRAGSSGVVDEGFCVGCLPRRGNCMAHARSIRSSPRRRRFSQSQCHRRSMCPCHLLHPILNQPQAGEVVARHSVSCGHRSSQFK
jgi:hypothetical protein